MSFDPQVHPLPRALSPSRLGDFQSCPRKYQYSAVEKIKQPASYASTKGRFVHAILERLFALAPKERTITSARGFVDAASDEVLTDDVKADIGYNPALEAKLLKETDEILTTYFSMEDPAAVTLQPYEESLGVEIRMGAELDGAPIYGILDRLDRAPDGSLVIVDYKTGSLPRPQYETGAFANSALYAGLVEKLIGEMPSRIRLLYIAAGETLERPVKEVFPQARIEAASRAWVQITKAHAAGNFMPTPSQANCRWCPADYKQRCRDEGVNVF